MACYPIYDDKGERIGFMCGDFGSACVECGAVADNLCDYPVGDNKTCDRLLCERCAKNVSVNIDYCPGHFEEWKQFEQSGEVKKVLKNVIPFSRVPK